MVAPPVTSVVADDLTTSLDPVRLMTRAGVTPDPWQADGLRSTAPRMLLNCARQTGKSTTTAALGLHTALFTADALVLLLSPSLRQSAELFRKVAGLYGRLGGPLPSTSETQLRLELANGSRIISLPATEATVRGYSGVQLLIVDEASRVATALYASVRPMLATSGGRLVALSTPFGTRGWWYDAWRGAEPWHRVMVTAAQCPRIPPSFLDEERRSMGEWFYRQEYQCEFLDAETQAFSRADIERAFNEEVVTWTL
jgi:hypothetical protein